MHLAVRVHAIFFFGSFCRYSRFMIEASNCGGVAVSGLEMAQNSQRLNWTSQEVDGKLKGIMAECYRVCSFSFAFRFSHLGSLLDLFERRDKIVRQSCYRPWAL